MTWIGNLLVAMGSVVIQMINPMSKQVMKVFEEKFM